MRAKIIWMVLFVLLGGCSRDWDKRNAADANPQANAALPQRPALPRRGARSFALLPDRGNLLAYEPGRQRDQSGAYSWHPVELSEAHALGAIATGRMEITAPDGRQIRLDYERHVEHPDGNWTWIGRDADGVDAVLTFGEKAAFGSIPDGDGGSLRLTTAGGGAWLVATELAKVAHLDTSSPDYLVPPETGVVAPGKPVMAPLGTEVMSGASTVVDLLLGYTQGFAASVGGQSQAVTRLTNMVEISNMAYANSGMGQPMRLVHALQVTYGDATDNGDVLERLSGYKSGTGPVPVDPAFAELRAARDQYGADLVALVRRFQTPQSNGCGIAWLIGGGQSGIDASDAPFGYSVVSDGIDINENDGKTYSCRQETLAHEIGHNMGQAHNQEDSSTQGVHAYSYGYREISTNGFYTVMAYRIPDGNQFPIRHFANPDIAYQGRPTGIAQVSDNVLSLGQTMPIISTFRATVASAPSKAANDVDGDGRSDLFWWQPGLLAYSIMDGARLANSRYFPLSSSYYVAATGDFNGDGKGDLLWTSAANDLYVWMGDGIGFSPPVSLGNYAAGWTLESRSGDINGDGKSDLLWSRPGQLAFSIMDGARIAGSRFFYVSSSYRVATSGDFDGNGRLDVLWTSDANDLYVWMGNGETFGPPISLGTYSPGWTIVRGGGDVNGDGKTDVLWAQPGLLAYSVMDGARITHSRYFSVSSSYRVATTGDFDRNGKLDIIWTSAANDLYAWMGDGTVFQPPQLLGHYTAGWSLVP